uniref:Carbohydrate sulfotransferase n=1 Tax=Sarcophilus harrisii TaxID=9305 RepID=A0A7N4P5F7_SARHA
MVMNLRQVFLSVLMFGVAGLLLFMYLQAWIEEQHTGNNTQLYTLSENNLKYVRIFNVELYRTDK